MCMRLFQPEDKITENTLIGQDLRFLRHQINPGLMQGGRMEAAYGFATQADAAGIGRKKSGDDFPASSSRAAQVWMPPC